MNDNKIAIYYNGIFHTMNDAQPIATAVACKDGRFLKVGSINDLESYGQDAEIIDLAGRFAFPGFIDTHSVPGIEAFDKMSAEDEYFDDSDALQWTKDALDFLCDKGIARLCLHNSGGMFARSLSRIGELPAAPQILFDIDYVSPFEADVTADYYEDILSDPRTSYLLFVPVFDDYSTVHESMAQLTSLAAENIGKSADLGTIQEGKIADLTIFEENPFESNMRTFSRMHASMVVVNGNIAYDSQIQAENELFDMMLSQTF